MEKNKINKITVGDSFYIVQILLSVVSGISFASVSRPDVIIPLPRRQYLEVNCIFGYSSLVPLIYDLVIVIACCYYAFRARKVPSNFNESKFIAVSVYTTLIVTLGSLPVLRKADIVEEKIATLTVFLLLNTYLALVCLYLPKFYAIRYKDDASWNIWKSEHTGLGPRAPSIDAISDGATKSMELASVSVI